MKIHLTVTGAGKNRKAVEIFPNVFVRCFYNWSRIFKKENESEAFSLLVSY